MNNLDNSANQKTSVTKEERKNLVNSASQKTEGSIEMKKEDKKENNNARCTVISEEILLNTKVRLCKEVTSNISQAKTKGTKRKNSCNDAISTSVWDVEEIQPNEETEEKQCNKKPKMFKLRSIDEMFNSLEENLQRKTNLKLQKLKKKQETKNKKKQKEMKKQERKKKKREQKKDDEEIPDLEFKNFEPKPSLDQPLDETTTAGNIQKNNPTNLKTKANTEQEPTVNKLNNQKPETNMNDYSNVKPQYIKTQLPDIMDDGEDALDNIEQEKDIRAIMDTVMTDYSAEQEFNKEKEEQVR